VTKILYVFFIKVFYHKFLFFCRYSTKEKKGKLMNTSYGLDTYRAHDLNIVMKTSSGDVVKMDFANEQSSALRHSQNENSSQTSMHFSSMQSFNFSIKSNGIDAQDQKEIDEYMKTAQPFIDDFLQELDQDAPHSPLTQLARTIAGIFHPSKERDENSINGVKTNIVKMFDHSLEKFKPTTATKIFDEMQKLLEKTLQEFNEFNKNIYA